MIDQCIARFEIKDGDLMDYVEGYADADVARHVAMCVACQKEVAELQTINTIFSHSFYSRDCPDEQELLAYEEGFLSGSALQKIEQHIASCSGCQQITAQLTPPSPLPIPLLQGWIQSGKRILAAIFQPLAPQPAFALRGDEQEQRSYQAGEFQIIMETSSLLKGSHIWQIEGKLINPNDPQMLYEGQVALLEGSQAVATDEIDEFGFFALEDLKPGQYTLKIELPTTIIPIEEFILP
ncbi:MAG: hypothetical protein ACPGWR_17145 [Ardenticatenaceae bacterium]